MLTAIYYKSNKFLLALIKLALVVAAFTFIFYKLFFYSNFTFIELRHVIMNVNSISLNLVLGLLLLSCLNWIFEILKWKTLIAVVAKISFKVATMQTLGALTASLITPNRIGDYGAKAMCYQASLRQKVMILNLLGNITQMLVTTVFGTLGLLYLITHIQPQINYNGILIMYAFIAIAGGVLMMIYRRFEHHTYFNAIHRLIAFTKTISIKTVAVTLGYAVLRYLIFSFQFYVLLHLFGAELPYLLALAVIATMYVLASIIPTIFIFDVAVKGSIAVYLFGLLGISEEIVLGVVMLMWLLNFVLPSSIGSYYVLRFKLPKSAE